ncbi:MAG: serine hydrolase domain-containing protein [Ignavibacteriaceae bacterium]
MGRFFLRFLFLISFIYLSCENLILGPEVTKPPQPTNHSSRLATIIDSLRYVMDFPALAAAIVTDTSIIDAQAIGSRRYGGEMNVTINDQFHLGSNSKAITAVLIGKLVDEGLVSWNTTLSQIYPEYANSMRVEYRDVTILNLLSHSSGFMRDPAIPYHNGTPRDQRADLVVWALQQPPAFSRGTYSYSNLGYIIVGAIAEKLTDRQFEELLIEKILQPLGITTAGFGPMGTPGKEDQPLQHTNSHSPIEPTPDADNDPVYSPPGRLHMSIKDWAKYIQWILAAEAGHQTLVTNQTAHVLTSSIVPADEGYYACGWSVVNRDWAGGRSLQHSGSNGLNYSEAALSPGRKFGIIVATNQGPGTQANPIDPVVGQLINYYLSELQKK